MIVHPYGMDGRRRPVALKPQKISKTLKSEDYPCAYPFACNLAVVGYYHIIYETRDFREDLFIMSVVRAQHFWKGEDEMSVRKMQ